VTVRVSAVGDRASVAAAMFAAGAMGVEETRDGFVTHAPSQVDANAIVHAVVAASSGARAETEPMPDVDWSEQWKRGIRAQAVGGLTIAPPWLRAGLDPECTIVIEPAMAFGTGEHATTRGVVRLLQRIIIPGDRVADLGAGSAVLAIAAAKLGAGRVAAIEIDHDAIENAELNVAANGVGDRVSVIEGDAATLLPLVAPVRVITANIISSVLLELLPLFPLALEEHGCAILSGILADERSDMVRAVDDAGWRIDAEDAEDIWWSATIVRP
jgi:ribosomal protein L11 methyltransferase